MHSSLTSWGTWKVGLRRLRPILSRNCTHFQGTLRKAEVQSTRQTFVLAHLEHASQGPRLTFTLCIQALSAHLSRVRICLSEAKTHCHALCTSSVCSPISRESMSPRDQNRISKPLPMQRSQHLLTSGVHHQKRKTKSSSRYDLCARLPRS